MRLSLLVENPGRLMAMMKMLTQGGMNESAATTVCDLLLALDPSSNMLFGFLLLLIVVLLQFVVMLGRLKKHN